MIKRTITTNVTKLLKTSKFGFSNCTSLVPYGTNLGSTVNMGIFPVSLQKLVSLPPDHYSMVVGKLLSDGWLERYSLNSNTRFRLTIYYSSILCNSFIHDSFSLLF